MSKKNSSKVSFATKEEPDTERQNPPKKHREVDLKRKKPETESDDSKNQLKKGKQKQSNEIDEIFAALKRRKTEQANADKSEDTKDKLKKKKKNKVSSESEGFNTDPRPRRRTNDGFVIYSAEELGINKKDAGQTALCPFDCSCCF
ncbi:hypothetical protein RND81_03G143900 [Saponaria officinalis]|uniref:DUF1764-domain-containing protein n=1 Tax=Saponaria officinalis TaxID=3572 RepID=A0AAW1M7H2_SAPOF